MAHRWQKWAMMTLVGAATVPLVRQLLQGSNVFILGAGNSGNRFGSPTVSDELAAFIASHSGTAEVTDEDLATAFAAVRRRALEGDADAALVLAKVASEQRRQA